MIEPITIRKLIDRVCSGDIRIPAFQRDFVWDADKVAYLLDSIYKKFPIGTVILWKTEERLKTEKKLGRFVLPNPKKDYPVNYVLDGQQRITSLFSVFQLELQPTSDEWVDIYFDMDAKEDVQESMFIPLSEIDADKNRYFPMKVLFDPVGYRMATDGLHSDRIRMLDNLQRCFQEYMLSCEIFESDDKNNVAIVFERINRAGVELNNFELLSAWSWSDSFDLTESFQELQDDIMEHGYDELCSDRDLQLRICAGIITGKTMPSIIMDMKGDDIRFRFNEIKNGIIGAIDFLKRELNVVNYGLLPFPGLIVPLSAFFATNKSEGFKYTSTQREKLIKWFWRSVFSRRYSAGVNDKQEFDIKEMLLLKENSDYDFKFPSSEIKIDFIQNVFSTGTANSKAFILMLSSMNPKSFLSGANIDLDKVLKKINKNEFHHIFPKAYLEKQGIERQKINSLANFCFLTRGDNNEISNSVPEEYVKKIDKTKYDEYIKSALIPDNFHTKKFEEFLSDRELLLKSKATSLMS